MPVLLIDEDQFLFGGSVSDSIDFLVQHASTKGRDQEFKYSGISIDIDEIRSWDQNFKIIEFSQFPMKFFSDDPELSDYVDELNETLERDLDPIDLDPMRNYLTERD